MSRTAKLFGAKLDGHCEDKPGIARIYKLSMYSESNTVRVFHVLKCIFYELYKSFNAHTMKLGQCVDIKYT